MLTHSCLCDMTRQDTTAFHMARSHMWHATCVIFMCVWPDVFIRVTWRIDRCDITHSRVWHDSFTCVIWLIHMCDMTHSHVWRRMKKQRMLARRWRRTLIDYMHRFNLRRYHACHFSYHILGLFSHASSGLFCSFAVLQPTQVSRMSLFILRIRSLFACVFRALLQCFNLRRYDITLKVWHNSLCI